MMNRFLTAAVVLLGLFCSSQQLSSDDSDHRKFLVFDAELQNMKAEFELLEFSKNIQNNHNHSDALHYGNLALLYHERDVRWKQGGNIDALKYLNMAINFTANSLALDPITTMKHSLLLHKALLMSEMGYRDECLSVFDQLLRVNEDQPGTLEARDVAAVLFHKADSLMSHFGEDNASLSTAIALFKQSVEVFPCNYNTYWKLLMALRMQKNQLNSDDWAFWIMQLESLLRSIEQVSPNSIVLRKRHDSGYVEVCRFDTQSESSSISNLNNMVTLGIVRASIYSALFIAADAMRNYSMAWSYLQQARHLDRITVQKTSEYSLERSIQQTAHIVRYFQKGYWPPAHLATKSNMMGSDSSRPVFIVGFFRSGSTLLESMLDAHPEVWGLGERSPFGFEMFAMQDRMREEIAKVRKSDISSGSNDESVLVNAEGVVQQSWRTDEEASEAFSSPYSAIVREHAAIVLAKMQSAMEAALIPYADIDTSTANATSNSATDDVLSRKDVRVVRRLVDKMLANYHNIGIIHLMFPRAIILHTVRDPLDTLFSCYKNRFADPSSTYTLHFRSLVRQYTLYLEIMAHFRRVLPPIPLPDDTSRDFHNVDSETSNKKRTTKTARRSPSTMQALVDVRYEELVANPERVMRRVLSLLGLPWDDRVLRHQEHHRNVLTASVLQVKKGVYRNSVGQWRHYAAQLNQTLVPELRRELTKLQKKGVALPFSDMNWALSSEFDYNRMLERLQQS